MLASGWIGVAVNRLTNHPHSIESPGSAIWIASPLVAVIVTRVAGKAHISGGWRPKLTDNLGGYVVALAVYPAVTTGVLAIG